MTAPARFTKADISRALRAANDAGVCVRIELARDGTTAIVFDKAGRATSRPNSCDDLLD